MIGNKFAHIANDFYGIGKDKILRRAQRVVLENKDYPFAYSNFGILVLGLVLKSIYNDSFTNIMNDFIRNDLHLQNTEAAKQSGNLGKCWQWHQSDGYIPAGSIISKIESMALYLQLFMNNAISYLPMTYAKIKDINANQAVYGAMNIRMDSIGMTWMLDNKNEIIWHNGATTDFNSYIGFAQDRKRGVAILSNLNANDKISMKIIGAKLLTGRFDYKIRFTLPTLRHRKSTRVIRAFCFKTAFANAVFAFTDGNESADFYDKDFYDKVNQRENHNERKSANPFIGGSHCRKRWIADPNCDCFWNFHC